jgi:probable F420-dependent oxidoreductase
VKPFRFGVSVGPSTSRAEWRDKARKVEALGFDTLLAPDHLADRFAVIPALLSAADATSRLRLGCHVLNNDLRNPVLVAHEAATVDLLTDGRFELGLGAGNLRSDYDKAGIGFDTGATRVARLAEAVVIIRRLLDGETVSFSGDFYRVSEYRARPAPVQRPHPPILIGGNNRRLLTLAAREADIVGLSGLTFRDSGTDLSAWTTTAVDERLRIIRDAAGEDRFTRLELSALVQRVVQTDDRAAAAEELTKTWPRLNAEAFLHSPYVLVGTVDQMVEDLIERRRRWGVSYIVIFEAYIDAFAPVITRLSGK